MTLAQFVQQRRAQWEQLDALLRTVERQRLRALTRADLKRLGQLYRALTSDLAFAQTNFAQSDVALMLNQLAARTHPYVYRGETLSVGSIRRFFHLELPQTFQAHLHYFAVAAMIFFVAAILGSIATLLNEEAASIILSPQLIDFIHRGEMWTKGFFSIVPGSIASTMIFTNNVVVSFTTFVFGLTFGIGTAFILVQNGLMLGCVMTLCYRYGMLGQLVEFITAHGITEISIIIVSGMAGLMLGTALLHPGDLSRRDALAVRGKEGVKLVLGTAPILVLMGLVEGFVSPQAAVPPLAKITLGIALGTVFYLYLFMGGRRAPRVTTLPAFSLPDTD